MSDDFTSLLKKKSPGTTFGDFAYAYMTGRKKDDKKARRKKNILLLGSAIFSARESRMQSNVMKQLEELKENKTLELQNRAYAFEEGLKKQTQYDEVKNRGAYDYYQDQAEKAFYNIAENRKDRQLYDNEPDFLAAKEEWKQNWSEERHNQFLETYDATAPRLKTKAEFNKPINDYFKSRREEITNPRNVSLVHKAFSFLPGAKERDKELAAKTQTSKLKYDKALERSADLVSVIPSLNVRELQALDRNKIIINDSNVRDLLVDDYGEDISSEIRGEVIKRFRNSDVKTYNNYLTISQSVIDNKFSINAQNSIKEASEKYRANKDISLNNTEITDIGELNFIRRQLGITDTTADVLESSQELAELVADVRDLKGKERENYIKEKMPEFAEATVNRIAGIRNPNELQEEYRINYLIDLTNKVATGQLNNEINMTTITRDFVSNLPKEISSQITRDTLNFLNENEYEYSTYLKDDSKIAEEIKLLQEHQFRRNSTDIFESFLNYTFNKRPVSSQSTEIPSAFKQNTINIDTPFK
jgi:hypothetical protein